MNTDKMLEVAAAIELEPEAFAMIPWLREDDKTLCGTVGCVAGTTVWLDEEWRASNTPHYVDNESPYRFYNGDSIQRDARMMLGLTCEQASDLFISAGFWDAALDLLGLNDGQPLGSIDQISAKQAAAVLRALAHGEITFKQVRQHQAERAAARYS